MSFSPVREKRFAVTVRQLALLITVFSVLFLAVQHLTARKRALFLNYTTLRYPNSETTYLETPATATTTVTKTSQPCLQNIIYDKPVKTGSTAVTFALKWYFIKNKETFSTCPVRADCGQLAVNICKGNIKPANLINHIDINASTSDCLRNKRGYYFVTSIREPKERIFSAYKYSNMKMRNYYAISFNLTFAEWMERFPRCALYHYYDLLPTRCTKEQALQRAKAIVDRFDEIIDLNDDVVSDLHRNIQQYLKEVNVSGGKKLPNLEALQVPDHVVEIEYILYNMLKEKRRLLAERPSGRRVCARPLHIDSGNS